MSKSTTTKAKPGKGKAAPRAGMPADQRKMLEQLMAVAAASGIRTKRKKGKPRGKPFPKGKTPPGAKVFQPGESGHPEGRPPATPEEQDFDTIVKAAAPRLARLAIAQLEGSGAALGADGTVGELTTPKVRMYENLWALAGRPIPRKVELSGPGGGPIEAEVGPGRALLNKLASEDLGEEEDDGEGEGTEAASAAPEAPPPTEGAGET